MKLTTLAIAIGAVAGLSAGQAVAQEQYEAQEQHQEHHQEQHGQHEMAQQHGQHDIDDEQIEKFVEAHSEINRIGEKYTGEIEAAETEEQARQIQQEAQVEMVEKLEEVDMPVEVYNEIAVSYQSDPDVKEKVDSHRE